MRTVKAIQFVPLGRPPKAGEWMIDKNGDIDKATHDGGYTAWQAVERREVEVEVPDPVPDWIVDAMAPLPYEHLKNVAAAFRALVEERARAAAIRCYDGKHGFAAHDFERVIAEEML